MAEVLGASHRAHAGCGAAVTGKRRRHIPFRGVVVKGHALTSGDIVQRNDGEAVHSDAGRTRMVEIHPVALTYPFIVRGQIVRVEMHFRGDLNGIARRDAGFASHQREKLLARANVPDGDEASLRFLDEYPDAGRGRDQDGPNGVRLGRSARALALRRD